VSRLLGELGTREVKGSKLEQWQYEVTGGGRVWYCPEDGKRIVYISRAGVGHPKETDQFAGGAAAGPATMRAGRYASRERHGRR
jgi:hypothetical protein